MSSISSTECENKSTGVYIIGGMGLLSIATILAMKW